MPFTRYVGVTVGWPGGVNVVATPAFGTITPRPFRKSPLPPAHVSVVLPEFMLHVMVGAGLVELP